MIGKAEYFWNQMCIEGEGKLKNNFFIGFNPEKDLILKSIMNLEKGWKISNGLKEFNSKIKKIYFIESSLYLIPNLS